MIENIAAIMQNESMPWDIYGVVVIGILAHWIYDILITAVNNGQKPKIGPWWMVAARVGIAVIAATFSFLGILDQLTGILGFRQFFVAFTLGFAVDAFSGPAVEAAGEQVLKSTQKKATA